MIKLLKKPSILTLPPWRAGTRLSPGVASLLGYLFEELVRFVG